MKEGLNGIVGTSAASFFFFDKPQYYNNEEACFIFDELYMIWHLTYFACDFCRYPYLAVVLNFSQSWALYCLVQFYGATKDELAHIKPLAKFLTFKSIVFLTWWQGVAIALLSSLGLFKSSIAQSLQLKTSVQDFIICIEVHVFFSSCLFRNES